MNESATTAQQDGLRTLYRHPTQRVLAGVCGGIADWLGWDVVVVRLLWVALFFATSGAALPVYIVLALFLPAGTQSDGAVRRAPIHCGLHASKPLALILIGAGVLWLLSNLGVLPGLAHGFFAVVRVAFWPLLLIFVGWRILLALGVRFDGGDLGRQVEGWSRSAAAWGAEAGEQVRKEVNQTQKGAGGVTLTRSKRDRILAGVCGGIAQRYQIDPALVRLLWAMVSLATLGLGLLAYVAAALLLPVEGAPQATAPATSANGETQEIAIERDETLTL